MIGCMGLQSVTVFTGLKMFNRFSDVKQWTGVEQSATVRQIIPVITPLLISKWPHALDFMRGKVNKIDDDWVHEVVNFAWKPDLINIHETMVKDVLHQLLKGMIMHGINWVS